MELDQLKNIWDNEKVNETPEISTKKQKEIYFPLEKIRTNMRKGFWANIIFMLLTLLLMFSLTDYLAFRWNLFFVLLILTVYYGVKFKKLYQKLSSADYTTFYSLTELNYNLKLHFEIYKFYSIVSGLLYILIFFTTYQNINIPEDAIIVMNSIKLLKFFGVSVLLLLIGNWSLEDKYGYHVKQISKIVNDLK